MALELAVLGGPTDSVRAGDWPLWRCDAARTAVCQERLPDQLHLQWVRALPPQVTAWKDEEVMRFDESYLPVVLGESMFVGSTVNDSLTAYRVDSGDERWRFYCGGPVRVAPAAWNDKVYVAADDGYLYCLAASDGRLKWKFLAALRDRRLLGNERLISTWPVRGGPVLCDGIVYFAAGVWPFMGTSVYALDAESGRVVWQNDSASFTYRRLPHAGAEGYSGLAPQGHLVILGDKLLVPGSRYTPAMFDRATGKFLGYTKGGSPTLAAQGRLLVAGGEVYDLKTGDQIYRVDGSPRFGRPVLARDAWYSQAGLLDPAGIEARELVVQVAKKEPEPADDRKRIDAIDREKVGGIAAPQPAADSSTAGTTSSKAARAEKPKLRTMNRLGPLHGVPWLCAGSRLVVTTKGKAQVVEIGGSQTEVVRESRVQLLETAGRRGAPRQLWFGAFDGTASDVLAAAGRLFVVTLEGSIYCYGPDPVAPKVHERPEPRFAAARPWTAPAAAMLDAAGSREGYCLVWGLKDGGLVEALARQSRMHVVAVDRDARKVEALRRRLDAAGLYGARAAVIQADPLAIELAPYLANLIVSEDWEAAGLKWSCHPERSEGSARKSEEILRCAQDDKRALPKGTVPFSLTRKLGQSPFSSNENWDSPPLRQLAAPLRPYGGTACLPAERYEELSQRFAEAALPGYELKRQGQFTLLSRVGPLPGSAPWIGQNADAGNTRASRDQLVMAPLGLLWYGNALSNRLILPRHGEGPVEQVIGGRLFIEGPDSLSAIDVYTGRLLWTRKFTSIGRYYNVTWHQPGAHSIGSNYYAVADAIYVAAGDTCQVLDPATGQTRREIRHASIPLWQFLLVYDDLLLAGAEPVVDPRQRLRYSPTSSKKLVVMDRGSGRILWTRKAAASFRHYGICAGRGKVFCVDRAAPEWSVFSAAGEQTSDAPRLHALDARTGKIIWDAEAYVGEQLSYSDAHDVLVSHWSTWGGKLPANDLLPSTAARRGAHGEVLWTGPDLGASLWLGKWGVILLDDTLYTQGRRAIDLLTGESRTWLDARGAEQPWQVRRNHGCSPMAASTHLLTFRSGCASFYDLKSAGGTGSLGGFRSGCTSNLIAADGVLSAPDYTRTCTCAYDNRSSLALVNMEELEYWAVGAVPSRGRIGYNFGAPGDRRAPDGTLWLSSPTGAEHTYGKTSPAPTVPANPERFCYHALRISGDDGWKWVAASGLVGLRSVKVPLAGIDASKPLRIRLCFMEPEHEAAGQRVFSVSIGSRTMLRDLDVFRQAGGRFRSLVYEFDGLVGNGANGVLAAADRPRAKPRSTAAGRQSALELRFEPKVGEPLICGVELIESP